MVRLTGWCAFAGLMSAVAGCGGGPEGTFKDFQAAVKAKDGDKAWELLSTGAQDKFGKVAKKFAEIAALIDAMPGGETIQENQAKEATGMTRLEMRTLDGRKCFVAIITGKAKSKGAAERLSHLTEGTLENVKVEGDKATATLKSASSSESVSFLKQGGAWKVDMPGELPDKSGEATAPPKTENPKRPEPKAEPKGEPTNR